MNEEELLAELVRYALPRYEKLQRHRSANHKLSDDEWWERTVNRMPGLNPGLFQQMVEQKEEMLQVRHRMMNGDPQEMALAWATEILPFVGEKGSGRLTKKQVGKAVDLRMRAGIRQVADRTTEALETTLSPAAIQSAFSLEGVLSPVDQDDLSDRTGRHLESVKVISEPLEWPISGEWGLSWPPRPFVALT